MSVFQMDTEQLHSAANTTDQLFDNLSEFTLRKSSPFLDTGDLGVGSTLFSFARMLSQKELEDIHKRLKDPSQSLFDIDQGRIGDCHLLSTLNAYNQTQKGREYLASMVTPHYNAQGMIDGYFVDLPRYERNERRVFVQDVMEHGDTAGESSKADLASICEKAIVQSHDGGTKSMFPHGGASASFSAITMHKISGIPGVPLVDVGVDRGPIKDVTIASIQAGQPVVAESSPFAADARVTTNRGSEDITIPSSHVNTVSAADELYANYGDVAVGRIP